MKNKKKELDVDFIGDPSHKLTAEDEKRISRAIAVYKKKNKKKISAKRKQAA